MHTTFGFTGQREETQAPGSSGLDDFNARSYDPVIGRFTSADPTRPDLGSAWGVAAYGYVNGAVETATDPSGLMEVEEARSLGGDLGPAETAAAAAAEATRNGAILAGAAIFAQMVFRKAAELANIAVPPAAPPTNYQAQDAITNDAASDNLTFNQASYGAAVSAATQSVDDAPLNQRTARPRPELTPSPPLQPGGGGQPLPTQPGGSGQPPNTVGPTHLGSCGCDPFDGVWLYRGLSRFDDPTAGLYPRNPANQVSPRDHVRNASRPGYEGDQFISLTRDAAVALGKYGKLGAVSIDPTKVVGTLIDLSTAAGRRAAGIINPKDPAWYFARHDSEVLLDGYIPPEAIMPYTGDLWSTGDGC